MEFVAVVFIIIIALSLSVSMMMINIEVRCRRRHRFPRASHVAAFFLFVVCGAGLFLSVCLFLSRY